MRFPPETNASVRETTTIRTESPRQSQYAFRNIDLAAREARRIRPFYPETAQKSEQLHGIFSAESWSAGSHNGPGNLNSLMNNNYGSNINMNGLDTEMSDAQNQAMGLTPQSSYSYNHSSSNTEYSPPNLQDEDPAATKAASNPPVTGPPNGYTSFSPSSEHLYPPQIPGSGSGNPTSPMMNNNQQAFGANNNVQGLNGAGGQDDMWKNIQGWDMANGGTPGSLQGMTPNGEWEKMMETMGQGLGWGMTPGAERN